MTTTNLFTWVARCLHDLNIYIYIYIYETTWRSSACSSILMTTCNFMDHVTTCNFIEPRIVKSKLIHSFMPSTQSIDWIRGYFQVTQIALTLYGIIWVITCYTNHSGEEEMLCGKYDKKIHNLMTACIERIDNVELIWFSWILQMYIIHKEHTSWKIWRLLWQHIMCMPEFDRNIKSYPS